MVSCVVLGYHIFFLFALLFAEHEQESVIKRMGRFFLPISELLNFTRICQTE